MRWSRLQRPEAARTVIRRPHFLFACGMALAIASQALAQLPPPPNLKAQTPERPPTVVKPYRADRDSYPIRFRRWANATLDRARPNLPEWLAMTVEILRGGQVRSGQGWFVRGRSRSRFSWESTAERLDADHDGSIARKEFPGSDRDFQRLDRDQSGSLTKADFTFTDDALERSRSRMILSFADQNHDGKIRGEEYSRMVYLAGRDNITRYANFADSLDELVKAYEVTSKAGLPYLTLGDLRETIDQAAKRKYHQEVPDLHGNFETAPRLTLLRALTKREIGVLRDGPKPGEVAPDFTLPSVDGKGPITLSGLTRPKRPTVLIFGNMTSPVFRNDAGTLEKLHQRYRDRAEFLVIYGREEHPSDGWVLRENLRMNLSIPQPASDRDRLAVAQQSRKKLDLTMPMVVDGVDDRVGILYSALPCRLYLIDARGVVAYQGGRGPFGFKPDELEQSLLLLLQAETAP